MGIHPNALLAAELTPDDLPNKTYLAILAEQGKDAEDPEIKIGDDDDRYHAILMDSDYYEPMQVAATTGTIVVVDMVTYGYGETIGWDDLAKKKQALEEWAKGICDRHKCGKHRIFVGANYW